MKKIIKNKKNILYIFILLSFSLLLAIFFSNDHDYYWHIKVGEYMVKNKLILTKDIYSWTIYGKSWISHEWLSEIIMYYFKIIFGNLNSFIFVFTNIFILTLVLFIPIKKEHYKNIPFSLIWITLGFILVGFNTARPQLIQFILLALTIYILYDLYNNEDSKKIYFLPLIAILWANIHGGSSNLVYIFPIIFVITGLFSFSKNKIESKKLSNKQIKKYLIIIILCIAAIFINPHTYKIFLYPYQNMMDKTMLSLISEWQPTNLSNPAHCRYIILVIIIILTYIFSNKKIRLIDFILLSFSIFLGFKSIRFWPYIYIINNYNIFYYISKRKEDKGTNLVLLCFICMNIIFSFIALNKTINSINYKLIDDKLINYLKETNPKRLYNDYNYGGYLLYKDVKVFVDGRYEIYDKKIIKDYRDINKFNNLDHILEEYNFDYILLNKKNTLNQYLKNNNNYKVNYKDKKYIVYKQNN